MLKKWLTFDKEKYRIPIKYKVILLLCSVIISISTFFYLIIFNQLQNSIEQTLRNSLRRTEKSIEQLMKRRKEELQKYARSLEINPLIQNMFIERNFDRETRNNIIQEEILPTFPNVSAILIANSEGNIIANNRGIKNLVEYLPNSPLMWEALNSKESFDHFFVGNRCYQLFSLPVEGEEGLHIIALALLLDQQFIEDSKSLSQAEITILNGSKIALTTSWGRKGENSLKFKKIYQTLLFKQFGKENRIIKSSILGENQLFLRIDPIDKFSPPFSMIISLDDKLNVISGLPYWTILIIFLGVAISFVVGGFFSQAFTQSIKLLQEATKKIENGIFKADLKIDTHDELQQLGKSFNHMADHLKNRRFVNSISENLSSEGIAQKVVESHISFEGAYKEVTTLVLNIHGMTSLLKDNPPQEQLDYFNKYYALIRQVTEHYHGYLDKYLGDKILIHFGAPLPLNFPDINASETALEAFSKIEKLKEGEKEFSVLKKISLTAGIHSGKALTGNIGEEEHQHYTAIGNNIDTSFCLEALTQYYGTKILISEPTYLLLQESIKEKEEPFIIRPLEKVKIKSHEKPLMIYEILSTVEHQHPDVHSLVAGFEKARKYLLEKNFEKSIEIFKGLMVSFPYDRPTKLFYKQCVRYRDQPEKYDKDHPNGAYQGFSNDLENNSFSL